MPRPIMMTLAVEELLAGKIYNQLDGSPGVISITFHGRGPKLKMNGHDPASEVIRKIASAKTGNQKVGHKNGHHTVTSLILEALQKGPLTQSELRPAVEAGGKQASSVPDGLNKLLKSKCITRPGPAGSPYKLTAKGQKLLAEVAG